MKNEKKLPRCVTCNDDAVVDNGIGEKIPCEMCQFVHGLPRPVVVRFADDMEQRLLENDYKGSWRNESKQNLADLLTKAATDLLIAISQNEGAQLVTTRAADVGNIAMMIANNEQTGAWLKSGVVIQDIETGLFLKHDGTDRLDFPFYYVARADKAERYERLSHALYVAYWMGEIGQKYRVIDYDHGGAQYVHAGGGQWVPEGVTEAVGIPAERPINE